MATMPGSEMFAGRLLLALAVLVLLGLLWVVKKALWPVRVLSRRAGVRWEARVGGLYPSESDWVHLGAAWGAGEEVIAIAGTALRPNGIAASAARTKRPEWPQGTCRRSPVVTRRLPG